MFVTTVLALKCLSFIHNNQYVPMVDFGKFQPHQTADDKVVITFGL